MAVARVQVAKCVCMRVTRVEHARGRELDAFMPWTVRARRRILVNLSVDTRIYCHIPFKFLHATCFSTG